MQDDNIEPSSIPGAPTASSDPVVEPSSIPTAPTDTLRSVVQESFKPTATYMVDPTLNSTIQGSESSKQS